MDQWLLSGLGLVDPAEGRRTLKSDPFCDGPGGGVCVEISEVGSGLGGISSSGSRPWGRFSVGKGWVA